MPSMWCAYTPVVNGQVRAVRGGILLAPAAPQPAGPAGARGWDEGMMAYVPPVFPLGIRFPAFALVVSARHLVKYRRTSSPLAALPLLDVSTDMPASRRLASVDDLAPISHELSGGHH